MRRTTRTCGNLLARSGCRGVLIGFESLDKANAAQDGQEVQHQWAAAMARRSPNLRRHGIRVYGTFIFGYGTETEQTFRDSVDFAEEHRFFLAAFLNDLTPFPGTPLYNRLSMDGRLTYDAWWMDDRYSYNTLRHLDTGGLPGEEITRLCVEARKRFYSIPSMLRRGFDRLNRGEFTMMRAFFLVINFLHRAEVGKRHMLPFGDPHWRGELIKAA